MAIRIRKINEYVVALCAAETKAESGDVYLDDNAHHALMVKFSVDLESEGWLKENAPIDKELKILMLSVEGGEK